MKDLLNQIKYKRKFTSVDKILLKCIIDKTDNGIIYCSYKNRFTTYAMFHVMNNRVSFYYNIFKLFGMDKTITRDELENYLNGKFTKTNQI